MVKRICIIIAFVALHSCNRADVKGMLVPVSEGVDKRFEQSSAMNEGLKSGVVEAQEEYMFYVATDPHIHKTHKNLGIFNDEFRNDGEATFGVVLGDCIDSKNNFPAYLKALSFDSDRHSFDHDLFHILGNHDLFFNGWVGFKEQVGPSVYWFEVAFPGGKDIYISLDTATGTLGGKQNKWFRSFLEANRKNYRHCVIMTHTNFFYTDNSQVTSGNMPLEESFALIDFLGKQKVSLVLQGHDHYREDLTYDNVRYTVLGAINDHMADPEYLKVYVNQDGIDFDWRTIPSR